MRRPRLLLALLLAGAPTLGCSDDDDGLGDAGALDSGQAAADAALRDGGAPADAGASPADAGFADAGAPDLGTPDLGVEDSGTADAGPPEDAGFADAGAPDSGVPDAGASDAGRPDAGGCDFVNVSECVVDCNGTYAYARDFIDANRQCPPFVRLNGNDYPDIRAAITAEACSSTCIYKAFQSVSFIDHCNRRNGYIVYTAANCPDLFEFSNGLFPSVADWEMATPCP